MDLYNNLGKATTTITMTAAATFVQPSLQPVQNAQALVQLLFNHLSHVAVDLFSLQQLFEGLVQLFQLPPVQGSQPTALLDLLPQLRELSGLWLHKGVQAVEKTILGTN